VTDIRTTAPPPPPLPDPHITLGAYLLHHYLPRKSPSWSTGTINYRDWAVKAVLVPDLGHRPVVDLSLGEIERWIGWRTLTPFRTSGRIPQRATLRALLNTLGAALRMATLDGLITINPVKGIRLPPDLSDPPTVWSPAQVQQFLTLTSRTRYATLWRVLFATGLRRGEALGLTWADIDPDRRHISVRRSMQGDSRSGAYLFGPPKTRRSRRTITIDPGTLDQLLTWQTRQAREFRKRGVPVDTHTSVFTTTRATPVLPSAVSDAWRAAVARTGLPRMRLHDIRHTHLSHLLRSGEPIQNVAARAGHGSAYMTLTAYAHLLPGDDERTAARAQELFTQNAQDFPA
jgi:integrase